MKTKRLVVLAVFILTVTIVAAGLSVRPATAQSISIDDSNNTLTVTGATAGTAVAIRGTITNTTANFYFPAITGVFFREVAGDIALGDMTLSWWTGAPGWQPAGPQFKPTNYPGYQMELNIGGGGFPIPPNFVGAGTWIRAIANRNFGTIEAKAITYVDNNADQRYDAGDTIISEPPVDTPIQIDLLGFNLESVYVDDGWAGCNVGDPALNIPTQEVDSGKFCKINAFDKVQDGIDNVYGSTVNVYPGTYNQDEANGRNPDTGGPGSNDFNIFVGKPVTIQGVNASGVPIANYNDVAAHIIAKRMLPTFGQSAIFVQADDVTITGLEVTGWSGTSNNKTVEVVGDNVTLRHSKLHGLNSAAAFYISDRHFDAGTNTSHVQSYTLESNLFDGGGPNADGIRISSGAGWSGPVSGRVISGNTFSNTIDGIAFVGPGADPWDVYPVGAATITGNTFSQSDRRHVIAWGQYLGGPGYANPDWQAIVDNNSFDKAAIAWTPGGDARAWDFLPQFKDIRGIYSAIQRYAVTRAQTGDTVEVLPGTYNEQVVVSTPGLTLVGPNAGVDPGCDGARPNPEATITWSTLTTVGTASTVVIAANGTTVDGFTIQNTNGTQNQVSVLIGGQFVGDTTHPSDGNTIRNNIITTGYNNVYVWQSSDNTIERNRVRASVETEISIRDNSAQGTRDALRNSVLDNCIDKAGVASLGHSVALGITGGAAQDFRGTLIEGNIMKNSGAGTGQFRGVDAYFANGTVAEPVKVYGNTITDTSEQGIRVESSNNYDIGGSSPATGNTITGSRGTIGAFRRGISTAGTSTALSIQHNTISGHSSTSGNDAEIVITTTGNTVLNNTLFVADSSPAGVGGLGLRADTPSNTLGQNTYQGDGQRMLQVSGAPGPGLVVVDATASTFKTAAGTTLDPNSHADLVSIEDRVRHHMDVPGNLVLVIFKASTTVATVLNNSTTPGAIQRGVSAVPGSTVVVGPGTFTEQVVVNKSVTLSGSGTATTFIQAPAVMALESDGDGTSIVEFTGGSTTSSMSGFTVKGPLAGITSAVHIHGGASATISGNVVLGTDALGGGLIGHGITVGTSLDGDEDVAGTADISDNEVSGFHRAGIAVIGAGSSATVSDNTVTGAGPTALTTQQGITVQDAASGTISGNTVRNLSFTGPAPQTATGIFLWDSANGIGITGNTVEDVETGIMVQAADGIQISSNQISDPAGGPAVDKALWLLGRGSAGTGCAGGDGSTPGLGCATSAAITGNTLTGNTVGSGVVTGKTPELGFTPAPTTIALSGNTIVGWDPGVYLRPTTGAGTTVGPNNNIWGNDNGVYLDSVSGVVITGNDIHHNLNRPGYAGVGIMLWGDNDNHQILGNQVHHNDRQGIFVGHDTLISTGNTILGNTVYANGQNTNPNPPDASAYGIELWNADSNTITNNNVYGHDNWEPYPGFDFAQGIYLFESNANVLTGNNLHNNNYGVGLYAPTRGDGSNLINNNTIANNTGYGARNFDALTVNAENNWWGACSGPFHPLFNPTGTGNPVSNYVDYDPWDITGCDADGDLVLDDIDNCPLVYNPDQANSDSGPPPNGTGGIGNGKDLPGDDATIPNGDAMGDACDPDNDNDGIPNAYDPDPSGDVTYDDNGDGVWKGAGDDGPSWDRNANSKRDGVEANCPLAVNPNGDSDGDGLLNTWEVCKWGTNPNVINSDGDALGDCKEAADVNGDGVVDFVGDAIYYAKAALLSAAAFGKDGDFDINGDGAIDFVGDVIQEAKFALINGLCK